MVELAAQTTRVGDVFRPTDGQPVACAAEVRGHLLHPLERRVERPGPSHVEVVLAPVGAEVVDVLEQPFGVFVHTVLERRCAPCAVHGSFGRGAIVAGEVDDECVVGEAEMVDGVEHPAHLRVGVGEETGEHLHQPRGHRAVALGVIGPRGYLRRSFGEGGIGRDDAEVELAGVDGGAKFVPAHVELAGEPLPPLGCHMVRGMYGRHRQVAEEGSLGARCVLSFDPGDRLLGQVFAEVVAGPTHVRCDRCGLVVHRRFPLRGFGADDAVETVEAEAGGPTVEWAGRALLPARGEVPLAETARAVARHLQHLRHGGGFGWDGAVVAGERVGDLGDATHVHRVVVAAGEQCGAGGRAQCRGVELVVAQALGGHAFECGHGHGATEGAA